MAATEPSEPALVALDWGTTSLRAWLLDGRGRVLDSARAPRGVMQVAGGDFAGALGDVTAAWPSLPAIAAGMVGSAQGWVEAPYLPCPASPGDLAGALVQAPGRELWIVPGVLRPGDRPDVMRGEETQIAGALALRPDLAADARLVLPGTHSKWARVSAGRVASFTTYMTGELFAVLRDHSILGRTAGSGPGRDGDAAFLRGVDAARKADGIAPLLFSARALVLTGGIAPADALDYLSGLLISDELRSALAEPGGAPLLIGEPALCARYARALARFGVDGAEAIPNAAVAGLWCIASAAGIVSPTKTEVA
ncbi:MAG TPA: 2-dehydro-3-deoxygalactonokinase [Amaricoccus sp.]|uniref:2-dehydro-3-deoxygalactonokinase n=1 Tax=Amaricoccus sp. TaxID=1872485 RepID=UPI002D054A5B|nr:2-dehydro-3-deoxygalactonokinase [Amaricoccus sp.]HMQ93889.1 2-dehydro-3-deoxygalactonokinase [Amaricoccus sp.]HMR53989.1 2-dehydro-3-deoxygalactonokinase [Amaricoccus sp.]HMR59977.1 2-dehydro-3-deoxygalactonokinase [Amaricoccus sp.]HMU01017.1 2-dehydro-3-deoxygalactonokinase [Amaricoccus sp.]